MKGVYSIAEVVDDSNKRPERTVFCVLPKGFDESEIKSLKTVAKLIIRNGARFMVNLEEVARYLNTRRCVARCIE